MKRRNPRPRLWPTNCTSCPLASSTVVTVPEATSALRWSGRALMKPLSMGVCFASRARYLLAVFVMISVRVVRWLIVVVVVDHVENTTVRHSTNHSWELEYFEYFCWYQKRSSARIPPRQERQQQTIKGLRRNPASNTTRATTLAPATTSSTPVPRLYKYTRDTVDPSISITEQHQCGTAGSWNDTGTGENTQHGDRAYLSSDLCVVIMIASPLVSY